MSHCFLLRRSRWLKSRSVLLTSISKSYQTDEKDEDEEADADCDTTLPRELFWIHPAAQAWLGALQFREESDDVIYAR